MPRRREAWQKSREVPEPDEPFEGASAPQASPEWFRNLWRHVVTLHATAHGRTPRGTRHG